MPCWRRRWRTMAEPTVERLRVCVLWQRLSGYLSASLRALAEQDVDVLVVHESADLQAAFDDEALTYGLRSVAWTGSPDEARIESVLEDFDPHALIVNQWNVGAYRRIAHRRRGRTLRIVTVHNPWIGHAIRRARAPGTSARSRPRAWRALENAALNRAS